MNTNIGDYFQKVQKPDISPEKPQKRRGIFKGRFKNTAQKSRRWLKSHRLLASGVATVMLITAAFPAGYGVWERRQYNLSDSTRAILTDANKDLANKLVFDEARQSYVFNKEHMPYDILGSNSDTELADQVAAIRLLQKRVSAEQSLKLGGGSPQDDQLHSTLLPKDFKQGVTYYDNQAGLSFSLIPKFDARDGDMIGERLVYPLKGLPGQAIYTIENTGVKEDIVLHKFTDDRIVFSYELAMSEALEPKLLENGNIGVYSADPGLFVDNATNSQTDAEKVLSAQKNAAKTKLVFEIPAPIVFDKDGVSAGAKSRFELNGKNVDVVTTNLSKAQFPLSIDPTIIVANSSSLSSGNNESNAQLSSTEVRRVGLTGGEVKAWGNTTAFSTARSGHMTTIYNNYMYIIGGINSSTVYQTVQYAPINSSTGAVGSWSSTTSLPAARTKGKAIAYNGYMYILGGYNGSSNTDTVYYAPINSNGTLGASWQTAASLTAVVSHHEAAVYKGFVYVYGGTATYSATGSTPVSTVQYAAVRGDGSLGAWQTTTSMINGRLAFNGFMYNGFLYAAVGWNGTAATTLVEYAPIAADGSVGTWAATTTSPSFSSGSAVAFGGYVYMLNGTSGGANIIYYAHIYENGTLGAWRSTLTPATGRVDAGMDANNGYIYVSGGLGSSSLSDVRFAQVTDPGNLDDLRRTSTATVFSTSRERMAVASYNGYVYMMGGYGGASSSYTNFTQYARIAANGDFTAASTTGTSITTQRADLGGVAYNGYLYNLGGYNGSTYYTTVQYSALNASTGAPAASWTNGTSLPTARAGFGVAAYNNYMYVVGGRDNTGNLNEVRYATINANGSVSSWNTTTALPSAINRASVDIYNGYIYISGGNTLALPTVNNGASSGTRSTGAAVNTVRYAKINTDGTIGSWTTTSTMLTARSEHGMVAYRGVLYAVGGFHNTTAHTTVEYAKINENGSIGTWAYGPTFYDSGSGTVGRGSVGVVAYNGYLYALSGRENTDLLEAGRSSFVLYADINNGGSGVVGSFTTSGSTLSTGKQYADAVYLNGYAYVIGGNNTNNYLYAPLNKNGTVGSWTSTTMVGGNMTGASAVTYNGFIYVIGGNRTTVYYGQPNADGSISNWTTTTSLPAAIQYANAVTHNGYVYLIGGAVGSTARDTLYYAKVNPDNTLGAWVASGNVLPATRYAGSAFVANGKVYYVGGFSGSAQRSVYYATLNSDGSNAQWQTSAYVLPAARMGSVGAYINGNIYIAGGNSSNLVYVSSVTSTGDITDWHTNSTTLPAARTYGSGFSANGYLYVFGGNGATSVYHAPINSVSRTASYSKMISFGTNVHIRSIENSSVRKDGVDVSYRSANANGMFGPAFKPNLDVSYDGTIAAWGDSYYGGMYSPEYAAMVAAPNGYGYMIGGFSSAGLESAVWSFRLNGDGTTSNWIEDMALPTGIQHHTAVVSGEYIYVMGGSDDFNTAYPTVYYAKFSANGSLSSWSTANFLPTAMYSHASVAANGYIYNIGGNDGSGGLTDVTYAKINLDGSLSSWTTSSNPLPTARYDHAAAVVNNYIYVAGGNSTAVYYAQLNPDGTTSAWNTSSNPLPGTMSDHSLVVVNGFMYALMADDSSQIYYARLNPDGTTGTWFTSNQVSPGSYGGSAIQANGYLYAYSGGSSWMMSSSLLRPSFSESTTDGIYYLWVDVTINDSTTNAVYADMIFSELKGITVSYRILAPTAMRLQGGKYFENNVLQPLVRPETNN